jgi:hypothetical protein
MPPSSITSRCCTALVPENGRAKYRRCPKESGIYRNGSHLVVEALDQLTVSIIQRHLAPVGHSEPVTNVVSRVRPSGWILAASSTWWLNGKMLKKITGRPLKPSRNRILSGFGHNPRE